MNRKNEPARPMLGALSLTSLGVTLAVLLLLAPATAIAQSNSNDEQAVILGDRFRVSATWRDPSGQTGVGFPVITSESARSTVLAFFNDDNWELMVKVLDGCSINQHFWVFGSASTDLEFNLVVEDLLTNTTSTYHNDMGNAAAAITDTSAFATCGTKPSDGAGLRRVSTESQLTDYLKLGLTATYGASPRWAYGPFGPDTPSGPFGGGGGGGGGPEVSQTNVQEVGVDEEDRIESDGEFLYVLSNRLSHQQPSQSTGDIRVLALDPITPSATPLADIDLNLAEGQQTRGFYLRQEADQLVVTSNRFNYDWLFWHSPLAWASGSSSVISIDVTQPLQPQPGAVLEFEGEILSSRRIDGVLYLATRFHPQLDGLSFFNPNAPASAQPILDRIADARLDQLLPRYRSGSAVTRRPLVTPQDCYLPSNDAPIRSADVVTLVSIDLDSMEVLSSKCFVGASETLYASPDSIYLATTRYDYELVPGATGFPQFDWSEPLVETDLHKFALSDGTISYRASGVVEGHLGWNLARKPFRMSESGNDLRVVTLTSERTENVSPVSITVLRDVGISTLDQLSRLPNAQRPEPIGKPGEQLYASRFVGDRAYLVTFLATDPLYVIDLEDPSDPLIAGELEVPGFSDYLHPIAGDFLVGVGKDAIPDPNGEFRGAWFQGIKVALYDVRDPSRPVEADSIIVGKRGSSTPVLWDHRAFTFLPANENRGPRFAFGAAIHENGTDQGPSTHYGWSYTGLLQFEVDRDNGVLLNRGLLEASTPLGFGTNDRSLFVDEATFYIHGDQVYAAPFADPGAATGPN